MGFIGWAVVLICLFVGATLFFSVNATALRIFSRLRLLEAFKANGGEEQPHLVDAVAENADRLILTCALYRLFFNMASLLLLVALAGSLQETKLSAGPLYRCRCRCIGDLLGLWPGHSPRLGQIRRRSVC